MKRMLIATLALTGCMVGGESPTEPLPERALFPPIVVIKVTVQNPTCATYYVTSQGDTIRAERYTGQPEDVVDEPTLCGRGP